MFIKSLYESVGLRSDAFNPGGIYPGGIAPGVGMFFAGAGDSGTRTSTVFMPTDSRREITYQNRMELVKKSRWLFNNLGLMRRLVKGVSRYSVGDGITPIPATTDVEWNGLAAAYFDDWASNQMLCDVQGKKTFWAMQKQAVHSLVKDGEFFAIQAVGADMPDPYDPTGKTTIPGRCQLQWLETQVIGNGAGVDVDMDAEGFREGVLSTPQNRAVKYKVRSDRDPRVRDLSMVTPVPADSMIHLLDADRAGIIHGLPWAYSGVNSALDVLDLKALESAANKLHSTMAGSIKKKTADAGLRGFSGALRRQKTVDASGKSKVVAFEQFMGGAAILQLATDEEFQLFTSNRTNSTWVGFMDYLVREIAYGFGVSPEFIWNVAGMGGANTRFILEDSAWFFAEIQQLLIDTFCQRVYVWVIARAMKRNELRKCNDPRYWNCNWQPPAKISVDSGNQAASDIALLQNGMTTLESYYAARGKSSSEQLDKRVSEIKSALDKCKAAGIPPALLFQVAPGSPGATALQELDPNYEPPEPPTPPGGGGDEPPDDGDDETDTPPPKK